ncbi:MAG TPA: hypothetical protein VFY29_19715 [Terriglobia bacterium]|nr:hypothetical protein [Terriglobia bacterium]
MKQCLHGLLTALFLSALVAAGCSGPEDDVASRRASSDPRNQTNTEEAQPREADPIEEPVAEPVEQPAAKAVVKPAPAPVVKKSAPEPVAKTANVRTAPEPIVTAPAPVTQPAPVVEPPRPVEQPRPVVEAPRPVEQPRAAAPVYVPTPPAPAPAPVAVAPPVPVDRTPPPPPAPVTRQVTIPSGTLIPVRMIDSVDSKTDRVGQTFLASIDEAVVLNGEVVLPRNADVVVKLAQAKSAGQVSGRSELQLQLDSVKVANKTYNVDSNVYQAQGQSQGKTTTRNTGIGAGLGALIGGLAGGGKGALIGAGIGGGAGVAASVIAKGDQVKVPAETQLTFRLENPVEITLVGPPVAPGAAPRR